MTSPAGSRTPYPAVGGDIPALPGWKTRLDSDPNETAIGGRYVLLQRLAVGGMAEIFLARQAARAGFEKQVVIKRLRSEVAGDPRVREMFLTEARIGAALNHPNIVHVYDVDEHDGVPFIAMEYIVGEQLNQLCQRGLAHGQFLPLPHAVELMRQAAAGLGYVHGKRARAPGHVRAAMAPPEGEPLGIVHLDISPTNLLVTRDGFLKVIDFGIARTQGSPVELFPGKLSYMSPEQASRAAVDQRSDIFSLGIVLYELTVGKRLFRGSASEVVERLTAARIEPPTFARRDFPAALESIVMRSLEKYPEDRYQNAYDLAEELEGFLRDQRLQTGPVRIARYIDALGAGVSGARRHELVPEAARDEYTRDDLGFDSFAFDGLATGSTTTSDARARMWDDIAQPDIDVAAALHIDPPPHSLVPRQGFPRVIGSAAHPGRAGVFDVDDWRELHTPAPPVAQSINLRTPAPPVAQSINLRTPSTGVLRTPAEPRLSLDVSETVRIAPPRIGVALEVRNNWPALPWLLVSALSLAVIALIAYIVLR